jgi:hypothetical protein
VKTDSKKLTDYLIKKVIVIILWQLGFSHQKKKSDNPAFIQAFA